jgi:hypothetical protein
MYETAGINFVLSIFEERDGPDRHGMTNLCVSTGYVNLTSPKMKHMYRIGYPINNSYKSKAMLFRRDPQNPKHWQAASLSRLGSPSVTWFYFADESRLDIMVPLPVDISCFASSEEYPLKSYSSQNRYVNSSIYKVQQASVFECSTLSELASFLSLHPYLRFSGWNEGWYSPDPYRSPSDLVNLLVKDML